MIGIITGATGQDGSYLVELLLDKGYEVRCAVRRTTYPIKYSNVSHLTDQMKIYDCDPRTSLVFSGYSKVMDPLKSII